MDIIATLPYIIVKKIITGNEQVLQEEEHLISFSNRHLHTTFHTFFIHEILDVSYRVISRDKGLGFLYLHTTKGMFSFTIKTNPFHFIKQFNQLKNEESY